MGRNPGLGEIGTMISPQAPGAGTPNPPARKRVLVVDDSSGFRGLLQMFLSSVPEVEVVGEAADGVAAVERAGQLQPDVVLLDLTMPLLDGIEAIPELLARAPGARVVALSGWGADRMARAALAKGAVAYLEKTDDVQAIRDAVRAAAAAGT
jgi:DNA-binding NarL/FixJ family response regulator